MQRRQAWAHLWGIVLVLLLGSGLRMVGLEQSPPGLAPDEACNSYDAYSIWHTGRDQHGVFLPTVMRALNDYRMPLFIYTQAPLVGAGGLTVFNARLAAAFWGILAIAALYRLGREWFHPPVALASAAFLAISPWAVPLNRIAHEGNATVAPALLVAILFWRWRRTRRLSYLIGAATAAGLGLYTYSVMNLFLPLTVGMLALASRHQIRARWPQVLIALGVGLCLTLPMVSNLIRYPQQMSARYREISVFRPERTFGESLRRVALYAGYNLSPDYLFLRGDRDILQHPAGMGQLYIAQAVLVPLGIAFGWRRKEWRLPICLSGGWLLAALLPVALTEPNLPGSGHSLRGLPGGVPWQLWSGLGLIALDNLIRHRFARWLVRGALVGWVIFQATGYFRYYFRDYPRDAARNFNVVMKAAALALNSWKDRYPAIYFTCDSNWPYLYFLFFTRYDPHLLQQDLPERGPMLFGAVSRVGKFHNVCNTQEIWDSGAPGLFVVPIQEIPDVPPLAVVPGMDGQPRYKLIGRYSP